METWALNFFEGQGHTTGQGIFSKIHDEVQEVVLKNMGSLGSRLQGRGIHVQRDASFRNWTTFRVGGSMACLAQPCSEEQLLESLRAFKEAGEIPRVLGNGSNILAGDEPHQGAVLHLAGAFRSFRFQGTRMVVGAGALLPHVALAACRQGLAGLELLAGIPGSVAGAVLMNAGCEGAELGDCVEQVHGFDLDGTSRCWTRDEMTWAYRDSVFQHISGFVILTEISLRLVPGKSEELLEKRRSVLRLRRGKFPLSSFSAGSFFRRTSEGPAGLLLDRAGMKGEREGDAEISRMHANFIINRGNATCLDVLRLASRASASVRTRFGVDLVPEVCLWNSSRASVHL